MKLRLVILILSMIFCVIGCSQSINKPGDISVDGVKEGQNRTGPAFEIVEKEIDLGNIPAPEAEIVGRIQFYNPGSEPLQIRRITGPCSCFESSAGDKLIPPGEAGELEIRFDKRKIEAGPVRKLINIETNDPGNKIAQVYFNFTIEREPVAEQLRVLAVEITQVRNELKNLRADIKALQTVRVNTDDKSTKTIAKRPPDTTVYNIALGESPTLGPEDAPVTMVAFADFQCPYYVREAAKFKKILQEHPEKVRLVFKHYPLDFHKKARPVHAAAELACRQGGSQAFWKMHDMIMAAPEHLEVSDLREYAKSLNLDLERFDAVMADPELINDLLLADWKEAQKHEVRGTPTVFINGRKLTERSIEGYKDRIDEILAQSNQ